MICRQAREAMLFPAADPGASSEAEAAALEGPHRLLGRAGTGEAHGRDGGGLLTQLLILVDRLLLADLETLGLLGGKLVVVVLGAGHGGSRSGCCAMGGEEGELCLIEGESRQRQLESPSVLSCSVLPHAASPGQPSPPQSRIASRHVPFCSHPARQRR